jgi:hypothetical protein
MPSVSATAIIVYVLTALAALVVVLTRLRLRDGQGAHRVHVGRTLLNVHTGAGVVALVLWVTFLALPDTDFAGLVGVVALGLWWVGTIAGLLMLVRWLPSHGKHAAEANEDAWSKGPWLSLLAHVGMLVGVGVFTFAYLTQAV